MIKNTNIGIAFRSTNTIHNFLDPRKTTQPINTQNVVSTN
jgi:hypothetical protein